MKKVTVKHCRYVCESILYIAGLVTTNPPSSERAERLVSEAILMLRALKGLAEESKVVVSSPALASACDYFEKKKEPAQEVLPVACIVNHAGVAHSFSDLSEATAFIKGVRVGFTLKKETPTCLH